MAMLAMPVLFVVIDPAPSVEEFLQGAWIYSKNNVRMKLVRPQDTPHLDEALTYHEAVRWEDGMPIPTQSLYARVEGVYIGVGSELDVYRD